MEKSPNRSWSGIVAVVLGAFALVVISSVATMLWVRQHHTCHSRSHHVQPLSSKRELHFNSKVDHETTAEINIEEKGVRVIRTYYSNRCYIAPLSAKRGSALALVNRPLDAEAVLALAGADAAEFCRQQNVYLLRDPLYEEHEERERRRRAADAAAVVADPAAKASATHGLNLPYEQRSPRCMDLVLDCAKNVGQVQSCFTYINGVIRMSQKCEPGNKFTINMTKPPGRILKITQQQWLICVGRRKKGLRC